MTDITPWAKRFMNLDDESIARRTRFVPKRVSNLDSMSAGAASTILYRTLEMIFVATSQRIRVIRQIIDVAHGYSQGAYPDNRTFLTRLYNPAEEPIPHPAICLTGLAGGGKSALLKAIGRLMPDENCDTGAGHLLRLRGFLLLAVKEHDTEASIFNSLRKLLQQGSDATPDNFVAIPDEKAVSKRAGSVSRYMPHVRLGVFRDGVAMVLLDELQFLTQGDATARILKTLLLHTYLGPPLLYTANYDMVHRLLKRAQQYRDRLLSNPVVLLPDSLTCNEDFESWVDYLKEVLYVSNGTLKFNLKADAELLHRYSFGLRRKLLHLAQIAYGHARDSGRFCVAIVDFEWAYRSSQYHVHRADIEELVRIELGSGTRSRKQDLLCPFDIDPDIKQASKKFHEAQLREKVAQQALAASMRPEEADNYAAASGNIAGAGTPSRRSSGRSRVKVPLSTESLADGHKRFHGSS